MPIMTALSGTTGKLVLAYILAQVAKKAGPMVARKLSTPAASSGAGSLLPSGGGEGSIGAGIANLVGDAGQAASNIMHKGAALGLSGAGNLTKGGSTAAGGLLASIGMVPSALGSTQRQQELYGKSSMDMLGGALAPVAGAAGMGVGAIGGAVGDTLKEISNAIMLQQIKNEVMHNMNKAADVTRPQADYLQQLRLLMQGQNGGPIAP